jgi:hypothetical protein
MFHPEDGGRNRRYRIAWVSHSIAHYELSVLQELNIFNIPLVNQHHYHLTFILNCRFENIFRANFGMKSPNRIFI